MKTSQGSCPPSSWICPYLHARFTGPNYKSSTGSINSKSSRHDTSPGCNNFSDQLTSPKCNINNPKCTNTQDHNCNTSGPRCNDINNCSPQMHQQRQLIIPSMHLLTMPDQLRNQTTTIKVRLSINFFYIKTKKYVW
ncbi:hypothetical protein E3U43_007663 [Larimichthys crocea]|uniref:Uncharacterized protein n=1 Tax=Larimichthys crocea TaxID=215358 RepID=A0ACD3Q6G9_LARCR|nr:hypothetical protein E3U43_007663 [Larimichthys crocea]